MKIRQPGAKNQRFGHPAQWIVVAVVIAGAAFAYGADPVKSGDAEKSAKGAAKTPAQSQEKASPAQDQTRDAAKRAGEDVPGTRDTNRGAPPRAENPTRDTDEVSRDTVRDGKDSLRRADDTARDEGRDRDADHKSAGRDTRRATDRDDIDRQSDRDRRDPRATERRDERSNDRDNRRDRNGGRDDFGLSFSRESQDGLRIDDVARDRRGASAGFRRGDIVLSIDGRRVDSRDDFNRRYYRVGPRVPIVVLRDGREVTLYDTYGENVSRSGGAYLGVVFDRDSRDAIVQEVNPGGPADKAGLRRGDMILAINGHDVRSYQDVIDEVNHSAAGDQVEIAIADGDRAAMLEAVLETRPTTTRYQVAKPAIEPEVRTVQPVPTDGYRYDNAPRRGLFRRGR